jgi:hypothetical protein
MDDIHGEDDVRGGNRPDGEGFFHVVVTDVDDSQDKYESVLVDMKIVAGTDDSQVGRSYREFFGLSDKAVPRLKLFGLVTGATRPGQSFDCRDLVGKQCVIRLERNEYEDKQTGETKTTFKTGWDTFYRLDDAAVAHVPWAASAPDVTPKTDDGDEWEEF